MLKQIQSKSVLALLMGGGLLMAASLAEAGQWLVVEAEGGTLAPGALLVEQQRVKLTEGARLVLLADDGQVLKLAGPYSGIPGEKAGLDGKDENLVVIASMLQGHSQPASALGALRTTARQTPPAGMINVDRSGQQCLSSNPVMFWRGNVTAQESVRVTDALGKTLTSLIWPIGQTHLEVSADYFHDGEIYRIQRGSRAVSLKVRKAAESLDNPAALAAWMAKNGCQAQALSVLKDL